jgi:urease accessory protein UreH
MQAGTRSATKPITTKAKSRPTTKGVKIAIASGKTVEWLEEESYFFKLSAFEG